MGGLGAEDGLNTDPPLVIELFGQPGAGKSTLVRAAAAGPEIRTNASLGADWKRRTTLFRVLLVGRALLDGSCLFQAIALVRKARLARIDSLSRLFRLVIKSHWFRSQTGRLLLEEGHLQELWSIFYSAGRTEPDPRLLVPLINCLYRGLDAQILFLDVDAENVVERIRNRANGRSRLDRLAEPELRRHVIATEQLPHSIIKAAKMAGLRVDRLDASLPIESTVEMVQSAVRGW